MDSNNTIQNIDGYVGIRIIDMRDPSPVEKEEEDVFVSFTRMQNTKSPISLERREDFSNIAI